MREAAPFSIAELLAHFPKVRPPLTAEHERRYLEEYTANRQAKSGLFASVARLESWMHRTIACGQAAARVLEIGAGTLNHVPYERNPVSYEVVEPFTGLYETSSHKKRISAFYSDIAQVPASSSYDRIFSIAVLEHLQDLPGIIAHTGLLLAPAGRFDAGIPTEGGLLWGVAWRCTTGVAYRCRTGLSYKTVMRHEHINDASEVERVVRTFYQRAWIRRFPSPLLHGSLYTVITAEKPDVTLCRTYLEARELRKR